MLAKKINPVIYTNSMEKSLNFYINETQWFIFDIDLGKGYVRLKSTFIDNFYISIQEKKDFDEFHKSCINLHIVDIEKEFGILKNIEFHSGASLLLSKNYLFDTPIGKFLSILDPSGNEIILIESDYL